MSLSDPAAAGRPPTTAEDLPDEVATLKRMVLELLASLHERDRDIEGMRHRIDLLLRRLYGPRGERIDPNQLLLFAEMAAGQDTTGPPTEPAAAAKPKRRCRPHGRRRLPENLPRQSRHHELSEAERVCQGCGQLRIDIGADKSERLDYRPASLFVVEHFVRVRPPDRVIDGRGLMPPKGGHHHGPWQSARRAEGTAVAALDRPVADQWTERARVL
jgi:hypothetical protein